MTPNAAFTLLLLLASSQEPPAPVSPVSGLLRAGLAELRATHGFPGATAACAFAEGERAAVAVGLADPERGLAMEPDSRMLAGSTGKTFVSAAALQLVHEGALSLDAPLAGLFLTERPSKRGGAAPEPWYERLPNAKALTLRHLLGHTAGLPDHVWDPDFAAWVREHPGEALSPRELVAFVLDADPLFAAGEGFAYADTNYVLAGLAIERATGVGWYDLLRERLLEPLELRDTLPQESDELPGLIPGHTYAGNPFGLANPVLVGGRHPMNPALEYCGGGVMSTSPDLARWALLLYGSERVVPPALREELLAARPALRVGPGNGYGLGVIVGRDAHGERWGHTGWYPGYGTAVAYWPAHGLALALQLNTDDPARRAGFPDAWLEALAADLLAGR